MQVEHVVCAFCGCVCDDLTVTVEDGRVTAARQACALGRAWLQGHTAEADYPAVTIDGQPASLGDAIEAASRYLTAAHYPLIYGLSSTYSEAQRQAVALADLLGANIDCCTSVCHGPSGMGFQSVGEPTCTLGEIKNRADLVIYWGSNPAESHPRHFTRYAVTPKGLFTPGGRKGRTVVLVDVRPTASARAVDIFLQIRPGRDFEVFWALRCLVRGVVLDEAAVADTGLTLAQLEDLAGRLRACKFGVFFVGQGLTQSRGRQMNTTAAFLLARDLQEFTKFAVIPMRGHGNVTGIDNVLAWQTGYPFGVNFSRGYPRFNPGEFTAVDLLARGEADAALVVASDPVANFPRSASDRLAQIPTVVLDAHPNETSRVARVAIMTATAGIGAEGTIYRMDNVPIRLRKIMDSPYPSDEEVLSRIVARARELRAVA
ncbi:MAG TPA: formylmethanofuran dehydrogenase subunit B [Anaerolineae bacterium]